MTVKLSRVYFVIVILWVLLLVPTVLWWKNSIMFLVFLSWYANFTTDLGNWMAARGREREKHLAKKAAEQAATQVAKQVEECVEDAVKVDGQNR